MIDMKKNILILFAALWTANFSFAADIHVKTFRYAGPFALQQPLMVDSVNLSDKKFSAESLLDTPVNLDLAASGTPFSGAIVPGGNQRYNLNLLGFTLSNTGYAKATIRVGKLKHYELYVDGAKSAGSDLTLLPRTHNIVIKYLVQKGQRDSVDVTVSSDQSAAITVNDAQRMFSLDCVSDGKFVRGVALSYSGRYLKTLYCTTLAGGKAQWKTRISEVKTGRTIADTYDYVYWMPKTDAYYYTRQGNGGHQLVVVDVPGGRERVIAEKLPEGNFMMSPTADYVVIQKYNEGPKEDKEVYQILSPEDRQPGWRDRTSLERFDLRTGLIQPLTFGYHNVGLQDISNDGRYILFMTSRERYMQRPTGLRTLYRLDLNTMRADTLIKDDGFISDAKFSPDGRQILVVGSPECLGGIGKNVPEGRIPNAYDRQLYVLTIADRQVKPLTKFFKPSVNQALWSKADGKIYFTADDRDFIHLFQADAKTGRIDQIVQPEDLVTHLSMADGAPLLVFNGEGASNADRVYTVNTTRRQVTLVEDMNQSILKGVEIGTCKAWNFVNSRGDTICGRYYLPPHLDPNKKYPLIVNYYGGCSPTSRNFETRYPHHAYAALGYVVYVLQPSGAVGFGQEFSSRHVNTAGDGVADDIIEGTKRFVAEHPYVDGKKIGCIGASYGGFMTQYLQTKTDIFAAAISHAGISDHTSYWGEGYWGYSYSEVSMAGSYPWTRKDLYVDHSPLFNADKIHTPLLFLHGTNDTNVPIGESIQMFTALKLLGRPTAFVAVEGEDHWIMDYRKRVKWQNTIFAWFAKWLKNDPAWWNDMYREKPL